MNNIPQYPTVQNVAVSCTFCGANVQGRVTERIDPTTKQVVKECKWICGRCSNLVKIGNVQ